MSPVTYAGLAFLLVFLSFMLSYWLLDVRPERQAEESVVLQYSASRAPQP